MADQNYTAILLIIDRSGSMFPIADEMKEGISQLLQDQAALPGLTTIDVIEFDDQVARTYHLADPAEVQVTLEPRGRTALFDAVGAAVHDFGLFISTLPEHAKPATIQVMIVSDGRDTSSTEYSAETVRAIVRKRESEGWTFLILDGDEDAAETAADLGTARRNSVSFKRSATSVRHAVAETSRRLANNRPSQV